MDRLEALMDPWDPAGWEATPVDRCDLQNSLVID